MSEIISLLIALIIVIIFLLILMYALNIRQVIVLEYERGLLYRSGKFKRVLPAGRYWYNRLMVFKKQNR